MLVASTPAVSGVDRPLSALSDDALLLGLNRLLAQSRRVESGLLAHVAEVDARRLWAREAFPSMFAYCTGALKLSESEAYLRITVGRASREHPSILGLLAQGHLHLSGIALLAPHLTSENAERLLARAAFKSKREVEELVAELAPRPDVPASIRKLPPPRLGVPAPSGMGRTVTPAIPRTASTEPDEPRHDAAGGDAAPECASPGATPAPPECPLVPRQSPPPYQPLAPDRYKVQFTASHELRRKLERLCALMRAKVPDGDLGAVIEAAVSEVLERIEARRFGAKTRQAATGSAERHSKADAAPTSRHIPASVRRVVRDRDGGRCTYVDASGRRCTERDRLEYHHRQPFAFGGYHRPQNLCLMCRAHNALQAEHDFGSKATARVTRRPEPHGSGPPRPPPPLTSEGERGDGHQSAIDLKDRYSRIA